VRPEEDVPKKGGSDNQGSGMLKKESGFHKKGSKGRRSTKGNQRLAGHCRQPPRAPLYGEKMECSKGGA